ncbi:MAG: hypothetical protein V2A78_08225 [bacterium]
MGLALALRMAVRYAKIIQVTMAIFTVLNVLIFLVIFTAFALAEVFWIG